METGGDRRARCEQELWFDTPLARGLLRNRYALPILLFLRQNGTANTSRIIRMVGGRPAGIVATLRWLEERGVIVRSRVAASRIEKESRLTLRGMTLIETPLCRWSQILRRWNRPLSECTSDLERSVHPLSGLPMGGVKMGGLAWRSF